MHGRKTGSKWWRVTLGSVIDPESNCTLEAKMKVALNTNHIHFKSFTLKVITIALLLCDISSYIGQIVSCGAVLFILYMTCSKIPTIETAHKRLKHMSVQAPVIKK